jgi:hypothetical protein
MAAENRSPRLFIEPPIPLTTEFQTVDQVRAVLSQLDTGRFRMPALMAERMRENPRLRAVVNTRAAGLLAAEIRFDPVRENRDARRAAREFAEDWPAMVSAPIRQQLLVWQWFLGFALAQRSLSKGADGRQIFKVRPYWPGFGMWYWSEGAYRIQTFDAGVTSVASPGLLDVGVPSPSMGLVPPSSTPWMVAEPFGANSWREAMLHACWRPWLGHDWAMRDQARASEKNGVGIIKAKYPRGRGAEHEAAIDKFTSDLLDMGSEGVVPLEQRSADDLPPGSMGGVAGSQSFDIEPFEFSGVGIDAIDRTLANCGIAMSILWLGHNLSSEVKSGGSYAAASVGEYIRDDIKHSDASMEWAMFGPQLARQYCEVNYGDPDLAPVARYIVDSTAVNLAQAQTMMYLGQSIQYFRQNVPDFDVVAFCERNRIPMLPEGAVQVPVNYQVAPAPMTPPTLPQKEGDE